MASDAFILTVRGPDFTQAFCSQNFSSLEIDKVKGRVVDRSGLKMLYVHHKKLLTVDEWRTAVSQYNNEKTPCVYWSGASEEEDICIFSIPAYDFILQQHYVETYYEWPRSFNLLQSDHIARLEQARRDAARWERRRQERREREILARRERREREILALREHIEREFEREVELNVAEAHFGGHHVTKRKRDASLTDICNQLGVPRVEKNLFRELASYVRNQYQNLYLTPVEKQGVHDMYPELTVDTIKEWINEWYATP